MIHHCDLTIQTKNKSTHPKSPPSGLKQTRHLRTLSPYPLPPPTHPTQQGAKALHNCLAYKLCYYRFGQMQTEYGRPPG